MITIARYFSNSAINYASRPEQRRLRKFLIDNPEPYCIICPLQSGCVAFLKNQTSGLPVKLKKIKIRHRYFNYLVIIDQHKKTIIEQRTEKGIWQNLYQFPLIESKESIDVYEFEKEISKRLMEECT